MMMCGRIYKNNDMVWTVEYHPDVPGKDIPNLSKSMQKQVLSAVETKLVYHPVEFSKPLRNVLKPYRSLRVGNYRVVFKVLNNDIIYILTIRHRNKVYAMAGKRN